MRVTSKGQVTIPLAIRRKLGILPHTEVEFEIQGNAARMMKAAAKRGSGRGAAVVARLRGRAASGMTTDQILAAVVRARYAVAVTTCSPSTT